MSMIKYSVLLPLPAKDPKQQSSSQRSLKRPRRSKEDASDQLVDDNASRDVQQDNDTEHQRSNPGIKGYCPGHRRIGNHSQILKTKEWRRQLIAPRPIAMITFNLQKAPAPLPLPAVIRHLLTSRRFLLSYNLLIRHVILEVS